MGIAEKEKDMKKEKGVVTVDSHAIRLPNPDDPEKTDEYTDTAEWTVNDKNVVNKIVWQYHDLSEKDPSEPEKKRKLLVSSKTFEDSNSKAGVPSTEAFSTKSWGDCDTEMPEAQVAHAFRLIPTPIWLCMG